MDPAERTAKLFLMRWSEQLRSDSVSRRARTLGAGGALQETLALAESWIRSGGQIRPAIDPADAGHGVAMLPDVATEAASAIRADAVLCCRYPRRRDALAEIAERLTKRENVEQARVEELRTLADAIRRTYLDDAFDELAALLRDDPKRHDDAVQLADGIVSELRGRGWSDDGLHEAAAAAERSANSMAAVLALRDVVSADARVFECFVPLSLPEKRPAFPEGEDSIALVDTLPAQPIGRPLKEGPYAAVKVTAFDAFAAAAVGHRRVLSTIGALTVFIAKGHIELPSDVVGVLGNDGKLRSVSVQEHIREESRSVNDAEVTRILASAWRASGSKTAGPLHDAIRLRHRALLARDAESRLLLTWSALERLTAGARGFDAALGAAKELVSAAVTFGKLRRDLIDLTRALTRAVAKRKDARDQLLAIVGMPTSGGHRLDRVRVLEHLLGDEAKLRLLLAPIYADEPLLVHRCHSLWKDFGSGTPGSRGKAVSEYHDRSKQRVAWQVGRIYRARNRVAHVGQGPERMRDLVFHAHFYLTQLVAICVHYSEWETRPAQELLTRRLGQYNAFMRLLEAEDPDLLSADGLMHPSKIVGVN